MVSPAPTPYSSNDMLRTLISNGVSRDYIINPSHSMSLITIHVTRAVLNAMAQNSEHSCYGAYQRTMNHRPKPGDAESIGKYLLNQLNVASHVANNAPSRADQARIPQRRALHALELSLILNHFHDIAHEELDDPNVKSTVDAMIRSFEPHASAREMGRTKFLLTAHV